MTTNHDREALLQAEADNSDESYFRLLIDNNIKYVTIPGNTWSSEDLCFSPSLLSLLPPFPPENRNDARKGNLTSYTPAGLPSPVSRIHGTRHSSNTWI